MPSVTLLRVGSVEQVKRKEGWKQREREKLAVDIEELRRAGLLEGQREKECQSLLQKYRNVGDKAHLQ